mmetsp:Transcript_7363/g.18014  ORF Transcript_7363/g.18014 Transcript_7363/m.18014 type:complete len:768 (+) Transcript_7363:301-2604(+)
MSFLNLHGGSGSSQIVERLNQERVRRAAKSVGFDAVDVDEPILQAAVVLFRDRQQQHQEDSPQQSSRVFGIDSGRMRPRSPPVQENENVKLEKLCINNCPANPFLEYLIEAAMGMDLFKEFELQGNMEEELLNAELEAERQREVAYAAQREREQRQQEGNNDDDNDETNNDEAPAEEPTNDDLPLEEEEPEREDEDENDDENAENAASKDIFRLDALGFRMRFSRRLRKLELVNLPITRDHAESLMYGIETKKTTGTGCRLDTLVMEGVRFVHEEEDDDDEDGEENDAMEDGEGGDYDDGEDEAMGAMPASAGDGTIVVKELCEGFPNNHTLKRIDLQRCCLTDTQIALLFDSLAHHPTLTHINFSENACRTLGLEALDRMLVSPQWMPQAEANSIKDENSQSEVENYCKIESLDLGYQFTSAENYGTGEHIQLDILTRNCTTQDVDFRIYPNLRKLVLQGNQIYDSDMKALAFLIRHRFPRLEELDLRFNEITTEGLEIFANHSDPNNNDYYKSSFDENGICNDTDNSSNYGDYFHPPASRLRTIRLTNNPLVMNDQTSLIILKLLKIYPELQVIQSNLSWEDGTPIAEYIQHFLDINRAGRVLLLAGSSGLATDADNNGNSKRVQHSQSLKPATSVVEHPRRRQLREQQLSPIPIAAWPLVLGRLTRQTRYPHYIPKKNCLNSMYYLIRHGPIIMEQMASNTNKKSASTKSTPANSQNEKRSISDDNDGDGDSGQKNPKKPRGDPALGGYATLSDFLRCELGIES